MPKKIEIHNYKKRGSGLIINLTYNDKTDRTIFITKHSVSRHVSEENLDECLRGTKAFNRDAFIFRGDRAKREITLNVEKAFNLDDKLKTLLEEYKENFKG